MSHEGNERFSINESRIGSNIFTARPEAEILSATKIIA